jgi:hypothetical protein
MGLSGGPKSSLSIEFAIIVPLSVELEAADNPAM